jgi:hypothetical protein
MSMLVVLFIVGLGPGGRVEPAPAAPAERVGEVPADGVRDAERVGLVLEEADRVGLAVRVGDGDAERVGLALDEGDGDADCVALAVGDGVADADGEDDVDGAADVVAADGAADVDGDDEPVVGGDGELAAGAAAFASAGSCTPADSPQKTSKPPAARLAITARPCPEPVSAGLFSLPA